MDLSIHPSAAYRLDQTLFSNSKAVRNLLPLHKRNKNGASVINSFLVEIYECKEVFTKLIRQVLRLNHSDFALNYL